MTFFTHFADLTYNSSAIRRVWFDEIDGRLYIEFPGGNIAGYEASSGYFNNLVNARSAGRYYNEIRYVLRGASAPQDADEFKKRAPEVPKAAASATDDNTEFEVLVEFSGTMKFTVSANGFGDAEKQVLDILDPAVVDGV